MAEGAGSVVRPLVLGPDRVPVVTDPGQARDRPELAVLSALGHGGTGPHQQRVLAAFAAALAKAAPKAAPRAGPRMS